MSLKFKSAVSSVVATALLLVVAVVSVVGFSGWFEEFSSDVFVDVEQDVSGSSSVRVDGLINDNLYLFSQNEKIELNSLSVLSSNGSVACEFKSNIEINNTNLIGWWKFDDNSAIINDYSGSGNFGKLFGETVLAIDFENNFLGDKTGYNKTVDLFGNYNCSVPGVGIGNGCEFSNDGSRAEIDLSLSDLDNDKFTVSVWFKPNSDNVSNIPSIIEGNTQTPRVVMWESGNQVRLNLQILNMSSDWYGVNYFINKTDFVDNWFNVVYTYSNNNFNLYVNGEFVGDVFVENLLDFSSLRLSSRDGFAEFNGTIDELGIYNKVLTLSEIGNLYTSKKVLFTEFEDSSLDKSLKFSGYNSRVEFNSLNNNNFPQNSASFILFIKTRCLDSKNSNDAYIFDVYNTERDHFFLRCLGNGEFQYSAQSLNLVSYEYNFGLDNYGDGKKYEMISFTYDFSESSNISTYMNSNLVYTNEINNISWRPDDQLFRLGGYNENSFEGNIEEMKLFNRKLSAEELKIEYFNLINTKDKNLKLDLSSCNLNKNEKYNILGFTDSKSEFDVEVIAK